MTSSAPDAAGLTGPVLARKAHRTLEPLHVVAYFAPEPGEHYVAAGLKGGMRQYFASRSAPLGRVPAEVVIATFYNFDPAVVRKAIPSAWDDTTPEAMLEARYAGTSAAYRRILGDDVLASEEMAEAAALAREATTPLDIVGRPLFAAHAALGWPEPAHLQLFHAQTLLREYRGDGHIAALVLAGLDAVEALVTYLPLGEGMNEAMMRATRGWSDEEWNAGIARAQQRGLLDADGGLTAAGAILRQQIEDQTDAADVAAYLHLGAERTERLRTLARPWAKAISTSMFGG
jgi:hypothetical protein